MPFYIVFVQLPQRFQTVNFTSAERAGILLLPVCMLSPLGALVAGTVAKRVPLEFVLILAVSVVFVGIGLLSSLPTYSALWAGTYGYEVITGLGLGLASPPYFMLLATSIPEKDISVGTGALNMFRTLGGCVGVAICSAIHREHLNNKLPEFLSPEQMVAVTASSSFIAQMPEDLRARVGTIFGDSFNRQFHVMLAFAGFNFIVVIILAIVRKKQGLFGAIPGRNENNEFMKATKNNSKENETDVSEHVKSTGNVTPQIATLEHSTDEIIVKHADHGTSV